MDLGASRGEAITRSSSAADLWEVADRGSTVAVGVTFATKHINPLTFTMRRYIVSCFKRKISFYSISSTIGDDITVPLQGMNIKAIS